PLCDRVAAGNEVFSGSGRLEEGMRAAAVAGICWQKQLGFALVVVQGVVETRHHPRRIAEGRMRGDVFRAFAVDVDRAAVSEGGQVFLARLGGSSRNLADGFGLPGKRLAIVDRLGFGFSHFVSSPSS